MHAIDSADRTPVPIAIVHGYAAAAAPPGAGDVAMPATERRASEALHRAARAAGADAVVRIGSAYRRTALLSTSAVVPSLVEIHSWGTAIRLR